MLKILKITVFLVAILLLLSSCATFESPTADSGESEFTFTFTDSTGTEVKLSNHPSNVAILFSSYAEIWKLSGGEINVTVGESIERGFADNNAVIVDSGSGHNGVDLERLIGARPNLVIGTADYDGQKEAVEFCRSHGIPSALFRVESFSDYLNVLKIFCDINGRDDLYSQNGLEVRDRIEKIFSALKSSDIDYKPRILFVRAGTSARATKAKTSEDHFACRMLSELGAVNIADNENRLTGALSLEIIIKEDPDYLFITTMGDETAAKEYMDSLLSSEGWRKLSCVKKGNYLYLPKDIFHYKPNARWDDAYRILASELYPDINYEN